MNPAESIPEAHLAQLRAYVEAHGAKMAAHKCRLSRDTIHEAMRTGVGGSKTLSNLECAFVTGFPRQVPA